MMLVLWWVLKSALSDLEWLFGDRKVKVSRMSRSRLFVHLFLLLELEWHFGNVKCMSCLEESLDLQEYIYIYDYIVLYIQYTYTTVWGMLETIRRLRTSLISMYGCTTASNRQKGVASRINSVASSHFVKPNLANYHRVRSWLSPSLHESNPESKSDVGHPYRCW